MYFTRPRLKAGSEISCGSESVIIFYKNERFDFEVDEPRIVAPVEQLIRALDGSHSIAELVAGAPNLDEEQVRTVLHLLDESFLLTEAAPPRVEKSGIAFATELEDLYYNVWMAADGEPDLVKAIFDGIAERDVLLGWGLESYHITSRAHDCLAPVLSRFHGVFKRKAIDYFLDEYRHDKLLMKSLLAAGFEREGIERSLPLPYTHAVMNLLARWASSDLLSFMGCLFVFEGTPDIGNGYIDALARYDLPEEFVKGQSIHNDINNDGGHGNVTRDFYSMVHQISATDQARVIRNLRMLYEVQRCKHDEVLRYYRSPSIGIPRLVAHGRDAATPRPVPECQRSLDQVAGDHGRVARLRPQLRYLHGRMVDALSIALDRVRPLEARYALSQMLVKHARAFLQHRLEDTELVPLPAIEAIANQMYIVASTDWSVFLPLLEIAYTEVLPMTAMRRHAQVGGPAHEADLACLDAAGDLEDLHACRARVEPLGADAVERLQAQALLLRQTADLLHAELAQATPSAV